MITKTKKRIFYFLYTISALIFFLYYLFPSNEVKNYIEFQIKKSLDYNAQINQVSLIFPPGIVLNSMSLFNQDQLMGQMDQIKIHPELSSIASSTPKFNFKAKAYKGNIKGKAEINKNNSKVDIDADLTKIQIESINIIKEIADYKVSGILKGTIKYKGNAFSGTGNARLNIANSIIELKSPVFNISQLAFTDINTSLTLNNMQNLQIKECIVKGQQASGNISGTIILKKSFENSILKLSGILKPHPSLIAKLGGMASLLLNKKSGNSGFPFKIGGTIQQPKFSLK